MATRRTVLLGTLAIPFAVQAALAKGTPNSALLKLAMSVGKSTLNLDGEVAIVCTLEAREKFVRVYTPLGWGVVRGFRLRVERDNGAPVRPNLHASGLPMVEAYDNAHYRELDTGETAVFRSALPVKDVFGGTGSFKLSAIYVPVPLRELTHVQDAIVFENGTVESGAVRVKVV